MTLWEECLTALGGDVTVLSPENGDEIIEEAQERYPFTSWGGVDWEAVPHAVSLESPEELLHYVSGEKEIYIFWDDASVPVVQTRLSCALNAFDDVAAIADTWLCDVDGQFIAEYTHDDKLHLGFRTNEDRFSRFPAGAADISPKTVSAQWRKVFGGGADDRFISRETAWRYAQLIYRGHPDQLEKAKEAIWNNQ